MTTDEINKLIAKDKKQATIYIAGAISNVPTAKEIELSFKNGKELIVTFGIRRMFFELGGDTITEKQFIVLKEKFKNNYIFIQLYGGLTRHIYSYKKDLK